METKLFIFLLGFSLCNGHIPFGNIISSAHSKIHEVAGGILDGITHGLNLNLEGNIGIKTGTNHETHQSNYGSTKPPEETIVVIVEDGPNSNDYYRPPGNYGPYQNEHVPPFNNNGVYGPGHNEYRPHQNRPGRPHHHHGHENFNNNGNYDNFNQGGPNEYGRPHNHYNSNQYNGNNPNRYPNYSNNGNPNYGRPQYPPHQNGNNEFNNQYGNNNNGYNPRPDFGNNNNGIPSQPPFNNNNQQNDNGKYPNPNYNDANNGDATSNGNQIVNNPTTQFPTKEPVSTLKPSEPTKPDSDIPLFIPLLPGENSNKNVTAPKRETDDNKPKPAEDMEEDFQLDIRIKE